MKKQDFKEIMNQINISKEDKQKILNNCILGKRVNNKLFVYSKRIAAALIIGIVSLTSITTYAAVNAYQEYMNKMSEEELNKRYNEVQLGDKEADAFSRPLTETERQRLENFRVEYRNGLRFPSECMDRVDGIKAVEDKIDKPYYDFVNAIFYIPTRELTDEELLQIIDVWEKANYSLSVIGGENNERENLTKEELIKKTQDFLEQHKQEVAWSDEDKIKIFVEKIMNSETVNGKAEDISIGDYEFDISLYGKDNPKYWITVENEYEKYSIFFTIDSTPDDLTVYSYHHSLKKVSSDEPMIYSTEKIREAIEKASIDMPNIFNEYLGIDSVIVKKELYNETFLVLTDEYGNRYRIAINPNSGKISELVTYEVGKYEDVDLSGEPLK